MIKPAELINALLALQCLPRMPNMTDLPTGPWSALVLGVAQQHRRQQEAKRAYRFAPRLQARHGEA
jgi:hypothetical protein